MCNCPNKIPSARPPGGRRWRARCQSKNAEHLMECSFMLCRTCGSKGIGKFSKMSTKHQNRSPIWLRKILFRDVGPCVVRAKSTSAWAVASVCWLYGQCLSWSYEQVSWHHWCLYIKLYFLLNWAAKLLPLLSKRKKFGSKNSKQFLTRADWRAAYRIMFPWEWKFVKS